MARELLNKDGSPMREYNSPIIEQLLKETEMGNKLYTEQQVIEMIEKSRETGLTAEYLVLATKAIELPSDEDIESYVKSTGYYGHCTHEYHEGIEEGAKWMRDKIGGNK